MYTIHHMQGNMELCLLHGKHDPKQELKNWGFNGPTLKNVAGIHWRYGNINVWFNDEKSANLAKELTNWSKFDDCALEILEYEGLIVAQDIHGDIAYFGDMDLHSMDKGK